MSNEFQPQEKHIIAVFFLIFLGIGLLIFDDYGLSYDEPSIRHVGLINYQYVFAGDKQLFREPDRYYGPFFEFLLVLIEKLLRLTDSRDVFLMRHLVNFLTFYLGVVCFYLLCKQRFRNWKIALLGSLFLIISPRIFAHAFYNSKDLAFLSVFIMNVYTLAAYLDHKTRGRLYLHAFVSAILVDIRIIGILVPGLTYLLVVGEGIFAVPSKRTIRAMASILLQYSLILIVFVILFFPMLWKNPPYHFVQAILHMKQFPWQLDVLYLGQYIKAIDLPWHYIPVWIGITTPLLYLVAFGIGLVVVVGSLVRNPLRESFSSHKCLDLICIFWFFLPILAVIGFKSVVYDEWRHVFFIYPALVLIALQGLIWLFNMSTCILTGRRRSLAYILFVGLVVVGLAEPLYFMIRFHPFQNMYFNRLAGQDMPIVKQRFEFDYWGLSYTKALDYIVKHDPEPLIQVSIDRFPRKFCAAILPADERERITCISNFDEAKYFIGNYRMNKDGYPCDHEFYSIEIDGAKIVVVLDAKSCKTK